MDLLEQKKKNEVITQFQANENDEKNEIDTI